VLGFGVGVGLSMAVDRERLSLQQEIMMSDHTAQIISDLRSWPRRSPLGPVLNILGAISLTGLAMRSITSVKQRGRTR